jgi:hypothetical protein
MAIKPKLIAPRVIVLLFFKTILVEEIKLLCLCARRTNVLNVFPGLFQKRMLKYNISININKKLVLVYMLY